MCMPRKNDMKKTKKVEDLSEDEQQALDVENADSVEEAKVYKKRQFMHKFKLGTHYRMERFSVMFGTLTAFLLLFSLVGWSNYRSDQKEQMSTQAKYTTEVDFSLSGQSGEVVDVYRGKDDTRAVVLIKMEDVANLSVDASTYQLFLTGVDKKLKQQPDASMFIFGSSGYIGIELHDEEGLPNQVLDFTLRANNQVQEDVVELTEEELAEFDDASFGQHDQTQFLANVGAEDAVELSVLDDELDAIELYYALVGRHDEDEIFARIDEQTKELDRLLARHNEYSNRLDELGFVPPALPAFMDGDYIDDEGNFQARTDVIGHHDIEYINKRVTDGFVLQVVDDVSDFREYMAQKRGEYQQAQTDSLDAAEEVPKIEELVRDDGYTIEVGQISDDESTSNELSARDALVTLETTWSQYIEQKRLLQITDMRDLLLLDADIRTQGNAFSSHSGEEFLTIW